MNPHESYDIQDIWTGIADSIFYEPRTIPAGWDLSELLPASQQNIKYTPIQNAEIKAGQ